MSTLPSSMTEATPHRASTFPTYFASRVLLALLLTGFDGLAFLMAIVRDLRNRIGGPVLFVAMIALTFTLAHIWYTFLRYRHPAKPGSRNPFR